MIIVKNSGFTLLKKMGFREVGIEHTIAIETEDSREFFTKEYEGFIIIPAPGIDDYVNNTFFDQKVFKGKNIYIA